MKIQQKVYTPTTMPTWLEENPRAMRNSGKAATSIWSMVLCNPAPMDRSINSRVHSGTFWLLCFILFPPFLRMVAGPD